MTRQWLMKIRVLRMGMRMRSNGKPMPSVQMESHSSSLPILQPSAPPSSTTAHPSSTTAHPSLTTAHPSSTTAHPSSTTAHPSSTTASATTASESHRKCTQKQQYAKDARTRRRAETRAQHPLELHGLKSVTLKHRQGLEGLRSAVELEHFNTASSGWVGGKLPNNKSTYTLEDITKAPYNLHHIQWDGRHVQLHIYHPPFASLTLHLISRTPCLIIDRNDCIIGTLAGQPHDPSWSDVGNDASQVIRDAGAKASFNKKQVRHRRGSFSGLVVGVSFGGGQKVCAMSSHRWNASNDLQGSRKPPK